TDLSKAASLQSVNKAKQMSKKQIERVEEMLDRYDDMFGPNYVPAMGGAGSTYRFADRNYMAFSGGVGGRKMNGQLVRYYIRCVEQVTGRTMTKSKIEKLKEAL